MMTTEEMTTAVPELSFLEQSMQVVQAALYFYSKVMQVLTSSLQSDKKHSQ
jgi:hypothetical protein